MSTSSSHIMSLPDIDIDVSDRITALYDHVYVPASLYHSGDLKRHPTGVYYQNIPVDPITGGASFPTGKGEDDIAGSLGYYKIDILSNHAYDLIESPQHLNELLEKPVDWNLFLNKKIVEQLHQLGNQFEIVDAYEPKSIDDLACIIAVIRPAKRHLLGQPYDVLRREVWKKESDGYSFKKSHAYAYALSIVAQLQSIINVST